VFERRTKLKPEFLDCHRRSSASSRNAASRSPARFEIPLIAYLGDTQPGPHLIREDVRKAQIVICECTFFEPDHKDRAKIGMHMHVWTTSPSGCACLNRTR
jgi:ribonuclease Z